MEEAPEDDPNSGYQKRITFNKLCKRVESREAGKRKSKRKNRSLNRSLLSQEKKHTSAKESKELILHSILSSLCVRCWILCFGLYFFYSQETQSKTRSWRQKSP